MRNLILSIFYLLGGYALSQPLPSYTVNISDTASKGYYFFVPLKIGAAIPTYTPTQVIVDWKGTPIYYKRFPGGSGDLKLHSNGQMSYFKGSKYFIMDSTFTVVDSVGVKNGLLPDGHELQILPNGNFVIIGNENITMDLSAYNYFGPNNTTPGSSAATVICGVIQEQDANKNVVFEWHCKDHYNFSDVDPKWLQSPTNVDWTHLNAIEFDLDGNYLLSVRHFNEITKIKRSDSSIIWRLGGNANQFNFLNDPAKFVGQHDIRRIANGNITLNDNGRQTPFHVASSKEYQLNENTLTATLVWVYAENNTTFSRAIGNHQRLSNGNSLCNYGMVNNLNRMFNVVKPDGIKIFEITFGDTLRSYRVFNYLSLPWSLHQPTISCAVNGTQVILDAGNNYSSYNWSNGATTQTIVASASGTYAVWVPKGQGGSISSPIYSVDLTTPCVLSAIQELSYDKQMEFFPNPFSETLTVITSGQGTKIKIYNTLGQLLQTLVSLDSKTVIPLSELPKGIYILEVNDRFAKVVKH